ncbi:LytR/AlgR family response regulator transcription factor [Acanthopleuribacter pedis]|uniref:Response regulator transcription factor n=1 Tax=Acanthopleuribacter pedis TaxID=442870 RepID=A0A8J7QFK5_9BACT|nr:LytTR family DNA-binding domain-containing protein [Acanthopleuribacter pedis]MBO1317678.1 response regulator transcription factor [Acanthopleuribacter pedis]
MRYLVIDDEPITHQIIAGYCRELDFMESVGNCYDGVQALNLLAKEPVDVLFLDVQMPKLGGFDLLRTLQQRPLVVIISAHREYALESYDFDVCDYLLKPFGMARFLKAVEKVRARLAPEPEAGAPEVPQTLVVKDDKTHHQVPLHEIHYIEACRNYCIVHLADRRLMTLEKISAMAEQLPDDAFVRIHRSYIVAVAAISAVRAGALQLGERELPVGRTYKANLIPFLKK